ncbi:VanW family protein [Deinococcus sonorensis]|uniref:VanW family protein n=2 Tax=Deinococcus sonorensis TaxID=309891 RepID=A0AAU7UAH9_9DEIO
MPSERTLSTARRHVLPVLGLGLGGAVLCGALALAISSGGGTIAPGLQVNGLDLGGLSREQALAKLQAQPATVPQVQVVAVGNRWTVPASTLGWKTDLEATVDAVLRASGERGVLDRVEAFLGQAKVQPLPLMERVDQAQAVKGLTTLSSSLTRPARNAKIIFDRTRYAVTPDQRGQQVNVAGAAQQFSQQPQLRTLTLTVLPVEPQYSAASLRDVVEQGNALVRPMQITLAGTDRTATLTALQVANLYWVRPAGIELDQDAVKSSLARIANTLDQPAHDARYALQGGKLTRVPEQSGVVLNQAQAARPLTEAVLDPAQRSVTLPVQTSQPTLTVASLPDPHKLTLIATGTSTYYHSSVQRRTNVANAASKIDGTVVAPGGTFSFLNALGSISEDNGFVGGLIISGGRTVDGLGGGVCQVSTTTFRALYQAGLPVVERNQHSYRVGYYEPQVGFEAAVYDPGKDLRLQNDTGGPLLIRTLNNNAKSSLSVQVWGLPQTRKVSVSRAVITGHTPHPRAKYVQNPALPAGVTRQVDWAADGYNLYITRTIKDASGVRTDRTVTNYKPWQAVYEVGVRRSGSSDQ